MVSSRKLDWIFGIQPNICQDIGYLSGRQLNFTHGCCRISGITPRQDIQVNIFKRNIINTMDTYFFHYSVFAGYTVSGRLQRPDLQVNDVKKILLTQWTLIFCWLTWAVLLAGCCSKVLSGLGIYLPASLSGLCKLNIQQMKPVSSGLYSDMCRRHIKDR